MCLLGLIFHLLDAMGDSPVFLPIDSEVTIQPSQEHKALSNALGPLQWLAPVGVNLPSILVDILSASIVSVNWTFYRPWPCPDRGHILGILLLGEWIAAVFRAEAHSRRVSENHFAKDRSPMRVDMTDFLAQRRNQTCRTSIW
jgi:hypothetical protein